MKQKIKSYLKSKKLQHKRDWLISIRQPHIFFIEINMKQTCKNIYLHIENQNTTHIPRKTLYIEPYVQTYAREWEKITLLQKHFPI
jgi:hypothetical protein